MLKTTNKVRIMYIKSWRKSHVDLFVKIPMKKGVVYVELPEVPVVKGSKSKK